MKQIKKKISILLVFAILISGQSGWTVSVRADANDLNTGGMKIEDGMAQPMVSYSAVSANYTNNGSDILRFAVYVETDYDTDKDGMNDLVQAVVQVPKAAAEGKYDAPTIFEASPYYAGTNSSTELGKRVPEPAYDKDFKEEDLYKAGAYHITSENTITSLELASRDNEEGFSSKNWYYRYEDAPEGKRDTDYISGLSDHDYFLIRGFAVVISAGLGTNGSDGLETCGSRAEVDAFKDVVEWIHGKEGRKAFADREGTIPVAADWADGSVAMRGCSYNGTMAYEVAATGVEGLKTIVPEAGISSWYEYSNTQGVTHYDDNKYTTFLASGNSSRFFGKDNRVTDEIRSLCSKLFGYFDHEQVELAGHYGDYWKSREFSDVPADTIKASALIVQGLNDSNVRPKQADLMRAAFERCGQDVRMILHQGAHETLEGIQIDDMYYEDILNKWYCHYMLGVDNGIDKKLPSVYVQSNRDGLFYEYDNLYGSENITLSAGNAEEVLLTHPKKTDSTASEVQVPSVYDIMRSGDAPGYTIDDFFEEVGCDKEGVSEDGSKNYAQTWIRRIPKELTIQGKPEVRVCAAVTDIPKDGRMILGAMLYDISEEPFDAYIPDPNDSDKVRKTTTIQGMIYRGKDLDSYDLQEFDQTKVRKKLITKGMINLGTPEAGYEPETARKREVPVSANTYYDYTIHMEPTVYTIQPGHYLWIYLIPGMDDINSDTDVIIHNGYSNAVIPVNKVPEGFDNEIHTGYVDGESGKEISETIKDKEVSRKQIKDEEKVITLSSKLWVKGMAPEYIYLGVPVKPEIQVYDGTELLTEGQDYKLSYSNNNKPTTNKDASLTISFKGRNSVNGREVLTYKIAKATLSDNSANSDVIVTDMTAAYTGRDIRPVPEIRYSGDDGKDIKAKSFKISYLKNGAAEPSDHVSEEGVYTMIIEPKDEKSYFAGKMTAELKVTKDTPVPLKNAKVTFTPSDYVYTGNAITPDKTTISIKLDGKDTELTEGVDYVVSLSRNNIDPGRAEIIFSAVKGNDKHLTGSVRGTFRIKKGRELKNTDEFSYNFENYAAYSKSGAVPSWIEVKYNGRELVKGKDYTISCKNNKKLTDDKNKALLIIKGKGNYKGSVTKEFNIVACNIDRLNVYVKDKPVSDKGYKDPVIIITDKDGKKLTKDKDFIISKDGYEDKRKTGEDFGTIQIFLEGKGNYFGEMSADYVYYDKEHDLNTAQVWEDTLKPKTYTGDAIELTKKELNELLVVGRTGSDGGSFLAPDTDFYVESYKNNTKSGTAKVVLRGMGIYGGTKTVSFKINKAGKKSFLGVLLGFFD